MADSGYVCVSINKPNTWTPMYNIEQLANGVRRLLKDPNPDFGYPGTQRTTDCLNFKNNGDKTYVTRARQEALKNFSKDKPAGFKW